MTDPRGKASAMHPRIVEKVAAFPTGPGCYVFLDAKGRALYVGKAADLRARVRSYLRPGGDGRNPASYRSYSK